METINLLLSSPLFYVVLIVLILAVAFRKQIGNLIERTTGVKGHINAGGVQGELQAAEPSPPRAEAQPQSPPSSPPTGAQPSSPSSPPGSGVTMKDVLLDGGSEIEEIEGKVKMNNVILDEKSRIGKIKG